MQLIYFDENKYEPLNPHFWLGGILIDSKRIDELEKIITQIQYNFFSTSILRKETEIHGKDIFQGNSVYRKRKLEDRIRLFEQLTNFVINQKIPIRLVHIDVDKHKAKYAYPQPEYNLGLMLILEKFCDFLEKINEIGIVFGDYEKDELTKSILDFSQFKTNGTTKMYGGRSLGRLKDTIYFTHSHHSRFLQLADVIVYMAQKCEQDVIKNTWHHNKLKEFWKNIKKNNDVQIKKWPT